MSLPIRTSGGATPGLSGEVDSMHTSATSVSGWSSERSWGLEEEPSFGINSGRDEEGGAGDVWDTSELLTADEGGREEPPAVPDLIRA